MTRRGRVTIREVAEAAGVSMQTVSRVLNNRPDVAPDTYERIQRIIANTGYSPNLLARGLTQGRSHVLGVVAFGLDYFGPSRVLTGIDERAAETGYAISLNLIHRPETGDVYGILNSLFARQVDGVIWAIPRSAATSTGRTSARRTCRCRSCSWAAWPGRRRCPRSASTTGPSAGWPPSTCSPGAPGTSASSPGP